MGILMWDKPKRAKNVQAWKDSYGFEDGPAGGYVPNMSEKDKRRWKAKLVGKTTDHPQVEIRKSTKAVQLTMVVSLGNGYNYKYYKVDETKHSSYHTKGVNVHVALNGGLQLTFDEMDEMQTAVAEAKAFLQNLITSRDTDENGQDSE